MFMLLDMPPAAAVVWGLLNQRKQIADILEAKGFMGERRFLALAHSPFGGVAAIDIDFRVVFARGY
ncbi:hypothetical protein [Paraburkholderia tropica]|uniref:hypothetical protein n=1 Tax=Paraburkholderia tropica TaxID=92647 RepID=UPI002AAFE042|nr:hypothetical protein [Paraburkholderia tropica]